MGVSILRWGSAAHARNIIPAWNTVQPTARAPYVNPVRTSENSVTDGVSHSEQGRPATIDDTLRGQLGAIVTSASQIRIRREGAR
jgi:hypothetical protein